MIVRKFPNLERLVKDNGGEDVVREWKKVMDLASTNFAACYEVRTACIAVSERFPSVPGGGKLIDDVCRWLYSRAHEKCLCGAPSFITGCDNAASPGDCGKDECICNTDECPWKKHTGLFD